MERRYMARDPVEQIIIIITLYLLLVCVRRKSRGLACIVTMGCRNGGETYSMNRYSRRGGVNVSLQYARTYTLGSILAYSP